MSAPGPMPRFFDEHHQRAKEESNPGIPENRAHPGSGCTVLGSKVCPRPGYTCYQVYPRLYSNEAALKDVLSKEEASKHASSKDASSKEAASKEEASKDAASKEAASKEAASKEESSKEAASQKPASNEAASKEATSKGYCLERGSFEGRSLQ